MKLLLTIILLFTATIYSQDTRTISIEKNNQGGYNIVRDGELIYEYTKLNCDSASLATLADIFFEASKKEKGATNVNILNLPPEKGTDWVQFIGILLTIFGAGVVAYVTNLWTQKTQRENYNRQIRAENKREWLKELRNESAIFINILEKMETKRDFTDTEIIKLLRYRLLLNKEKHNQLYQDISDFILNVGTANKTKITKGSILSQMGDLINNTQDELDRGNF